MIAEGYIFVMLLRGKIQGWQNHNFFLIKKSDFFYLNRIYFGLNQIMIYITIFHFFLGYCSYNCHNYVNNLAEQVCNQARL